MMRTRGRMAGKSGRIAERKNDAKISRKKNDRKKDAWNEKKKDRQKIGRGEGRIMSV